MRGGRGEIRIIGGAWRSRRIRFPAVRGLRPTPDRLRETLFDWLGPWVVGRSTLDLYAGSGALGIEALSRGASEAVFVERSRRAAAALKANLATLGADNGRVVCADVQAWLHRCTRAFNLVCVDPPYDENRLPEVLAVLAERALLVPEHRVYVEQRRGAAAPVGWRILRSSAAGEAQAQLLCRSAAAHQHDGTDGAQREHAVR